MSKSSSLTDVRVLTSSQSLVNAVTKIELAHKRSLFNYAGDDFSAFMKITVTEPRAVPRVRDECELGLCVVSVILTLGPFHAFLRRERPTSEAYSPDLSRLSKATFRSFCDS